VGINRRHVVQIISKIGFRLSLGFLIILLILVSVTLFAINRMNVLSEQTDNIYRHPLAVSNAVLRINANIIKIHRAMKDIVLNENEEHIWQDEQLANRLETEVLKDFIIINERFLGKKETYEDAINVFKAWKPVRDEVISLMHNGEVKKAVAITRGKGASHVEEIEESMEALGDFAEGKAKEFRGNAIHTKALSFNTLYLVLVIAVLVSFILASYFTLSITNPISSIKETIESVGEGKTNARIRFESKDELGELAKTFNSMMTSLSEVTTSRDELNKEIEERKKAEETLRKSETLLKRIAENYPNSYLSLIGKDFTVGFSSGQEFRNQNLDPASFIGLNVKDVFGDKFATVKEHYMKAFNGEEVTFEMHMNEQFQHYTALPLPDESGEINRIFAVVQNVTEQKKFEEGLKKALSDKDLLMKEIHHRVKNNLTVIQSLLSLQVKDISDDKAKGYLSAAENRVKSMTMIHEMLHKADDLTKLGAAAYIRNLVEVLFNNYKIQPHHIELSLDIQESNLDIDTMIPLGLIINELVSNALKYAFPNDMKGKLLLSLKETEDANYELVIKDTGVGLPADFDIMKAKSLGLQIVNSLIGQIGGTLEVSNKAGAEFRIAFSEKRLE
jgi:two-component sensor histidine kinase/HAMP domain-containing protein